MECVCKSKPNYHREDCPLYETDGTPKTTSKSKPNNKIEQEFNEDFELYLGNVIPFYFKLQPHSSFYRLYAYDKVNGGNVSFDDVHEYTKIKLGDFCALYFAQTGIRITFN